MSDRRRQIELLVGSRFDLLWFPRGSLRTDAGFAPGERVACGDCAVEPGWRHDRFGRRFPCVTCGGASEPSGSGGQWLSRDRGRGFVFVDAMDLLSVPVGDVETRASARPRATVRCDACDGAGVVRGERCRWCDGEGRRDLHAFELRLDDGEIDPDPSPLEDAIVRRDQAGSYHELDVAIAGISHHANKPLRFTAVTVHAAAARRLLDEVFLHGDRQVDELSTFERELLEITLAYLDSRMPDTIRVPRSVVENAKARAAATPAKGQVLNGHSRSKRDSQIREWARAGRPYQWIAQQVGLRDRQVREIING